MYSRKSESDRNTQSDQQESLPGSPSSSFSLSYNPELSSLYFSQPPKTSPSSPELNIMSSSSEASFKSNDELNNKSNIDDDDDSAVVALSENTDHSPSPPLQYKHWSKSPTPQHVSVTHELEAAEQQTGLVFDENHASDGGNGSDTDDIPAIAKVLGVKRRDGVLYAVVELDDKTRKVFPTEYLQRTHPLALCHYYESIMEFTEETAAKS